jgi:hypothetical protein
MDLDALLRDTSPVPDPTASALADGHAALEAALTPAARVVALKQVRRKRGRRLALTALVASAASIALVVGPTVSLGGKPHANAAAAQVLLRAGAAAGAQDGDWQDAAYWHSVSSYARDGREIRREVWIGHHASGVLRDPGVDPGSASPDGNAVVVPPGIPLEVALFPAGGSGVTWDGLWDLPTDADELEQRLRSGIHDGDGKERDDDAALFVIVGDLLRESPAPPALRKALWQVAARIPGIELGGEVTDHAGRPGVAVERDGQRYVLDPSSGRLLEESSTGWRATYLEQGPAETAPASDPQPTK